MLGINITEMARLRLLLLTLAVVLLTAAEGRAAEHSLRVVAPPDGIWVSEAKLFLAGTSSGPARTVKISGAGKTEVQPGGVFGTIVSLDRGLNTIKVQADGATIAVRIFYAANPQRDQPPPDFKRWYGHRAPVVRDCQQCHRFKNGAFDFTRLIPARSDCTTSCHQDKGKAKHVHGPVGAGICISCHSPHGSFNPAFVSKAGGALCTSCHQTRQEEFSQAVVHPPVEEGCSECHNPHESPNRYQLVYAGESVSALCFSCHDQEMFMAATQHSPVAEGDCLACHRPHSSENAALLLVPAAGGALCFECHEDLKEDLAMEYVHAPAEESCTECHDPHSAQAAYMLKEAGGALCAGCHREATPEVYEAIDNATAEHPPVSEGRCVACHRPHSSNYASLLADSTEKVCLSCHTDLGEGINASKNRHGPVKTGDCTACHNVHGSKYDRLLARYYPVDFYSAYDENKYDLCFGCHNRDIARTKRTETLTGFRDGSYNLHFFHVNNSKGRTCTACHDAHASNQAKHIRDEVPFGAWSYPINLTKTATGGSCVVGCHAPKKYDRQNPQILK
jgi:predicted CXXCH cytochrome family protein